MCVSPATQGGGPPPGGETGRNGKGRAPAPVEREPGLSPCVSFLRQLLGVGAGVASGVVVASGAGVATGAGAGSAAILASASMAR